MQFTTLKNNTRHFSSQTIPAFRFCYANLHTMNFICKCKSLQNIFSVNVIEWNWIKYVCEITVIFLFYVSLWFMTVGISITNEWAINNWNLSFRKLSCYFYLFLSFQIMINVHFCIKFHNKHGNMNDNDREFYDKNYWIFFQPRFENSTWTFSSKNNLSNFYFHELPTHFHHWK